MVVPSILKEKTEQKIMDFKLCIWKNVYLSNIQLGGVEEGGGETGRERENKLG